MVAAWIRAETGVGPSIASGNQTWSGNWALFPTAPAKMRSEVKVATGMPHKVTSFRCLRVSGAKISRKVNVPA
jgi:hypothetical protein